MIKVINSLKCKCPKCRKGNIFINKGNVLFFDIPRMNNHCNECNYKFERETGFFFGAMFVSYGLSVIQMIISLVVFWAFADMPPLSVFIIISTIAILTSTINFRVSRSIWITLFL